MTSYRTALIAVALCVLPCVSHAQAEEGVVRESRNAAATFMATMNFVVGRLGLECLAEIGRRESPKDYVLAWRERNGEYYAATTAYMSRRLDAARASGGDQAREAVMRDYVSSVQQNGEASVAEWFRTGTHAAGCRRAIAAIDAGALDINAKSPIHAELKALVEWAAGNTPR